MSVGVNLYVLYKSEVFFHTKEKNIWTIFIIGIKPLNNTYDETTMLSHQVAIILWFH